MSEKRKGFLYFMARQEKMPYLLTLLVALCGWGLTHLVDRLLQSPLVEYEMAFPGEKNGRRTLQCTITNISGDKSFQDVTFTLLADAGKYQFSDCRMKIFAPADLAENVACGADYIKFTVPEFQPGWQLQLTAAVGGAAGSGPVAYPTLQFTSVQQGHPPRPLRLVRKSWETLFVKYENRCIIVLILCWLLLITGLSVYLYRAERPERPGAKEVAS